MENQITNPVLSQTLLDILAGGNPGLAFLNLMLQNLIIIFFIIAALVFFFMILVSGIQWMTSAGDPKGLEAARGRLIAALIGLVIVLSIYAILALLKTLFEIDLTKLDVSRLFIDNEIKDATK